MAFVIVTSGARTVICATVVLVALSVAVLLVEAFNRLARLKPSAYGSLLARAYRLITIFFELAEPVLMLPKSILILFEPASRVTVKSPL